MRRVMASSVRVCLAWGAWRGRRRRAFTLLELLVAVGALALVAVGIAAIFEATGRTISAGKRVSAFTTYAGLIERQMRADFASMSRDGFLVIRNEYAGVAQGSADADAVPLFDGDTAPRPRRIDQIMFFSKGPYTTARQALDPAFVARADAARIYYGHGQRDRLSSVGFGEPRFLLPLIDDNNLQPFELPQQRLGNNISGNPNRFASDWILLRHVTLLSPPQNAVRPASSSPNFFGIAWNSPRLRDSRIQSALQPAASSVFRSLVARFPLSTPAVESIWSGELSGSASAVFSSGLIDIAATDLSEVRLVMVTADVFPGGVTDSFFDASANSRPDGRNAGPDGLFRFLPDPGNPQSPRDDEQVIRRMHSWMDDAWPTDATNATPGQRSRIRAELSPVNYLGANDPPVNPAGWNAQLLETIRRANQLMLSSSNFLPRCTEFIVEWSFGNTYPTDSSDPNYVQGLEGQVIWHGMERRTASTQSLGGLSPNNARQVPVAFPYLDGVGSGSNKLSRLSRLWVPWRRVDGQIASGTTAQTPIPPLDERAHLVRTELVHGFGSGQLPASRFAPVNSYFGIVDPTFTPDRDPPGGNGSIENAGDSASPTLAWAWPRLIRVTLSLADPADPTTEQTFQFVFDVPAER